VRLTVTISCFIVLLSFKSYSAAEDTLSEKYYLSLCYNFFQDGKYNECIASCNKALQINPSNPNSYNILSISLQREYKYEESLAMAKKAIELDPNSSDLYQTLVFAYEGLMDWEGEKEACIKGLQLNPKNPTLSYQLDLTNKNIASRKISNIILSAVILFLIIGFFLFRNSHRPISSILHAGNLNTIEMMLIASSAICILYFLFFKYSEYIWSSHLKIPHSEIVPVVGRFSNEHDGKEGYILYLLMFAHIILTLALIRLVASVKNKANSLFIFSGMLTLVSFFLFSIGFYPCMGSVIRSNTDLLIIMATVSAITFLMWQIHKRKPTLFKYIIAILLLPICFIATEPIGIFDYSYILAPALRLLNGFHVSEIYFQYDLFLSLLAAAWMNLKMDLNSFQVVGEASVYLFFIGVFVLAYNLFENKKIAVFLLIELVIIKCYGLMGNNNPSTLFQVTPLRLDLWLMILFTVHYKGIYHWSVGCIVGLLVLIHKNFGLIYLASYFELCIILYIVDISSQSVNRKNIYSLLGVTAKKHFFLNFKNLLIIGSFILISIYLYQGFVAESAVLYQQMGIGMLPVARNSFYWYFPIILSLIIVLVIKNKYQLSERYFTTAFLIVLLAIGNSMYFFGRSHENNIINIAGILLLAVFLLFDLLTLEINNSTVTANEKADGKKKIKKTQASKYHIPYEKWKKNITISLPVICILLSAYYYSENIKGKIKVQFENLLKSQFIYPLNNIPTSADFASIKKITHSNPNVYFLNYYDDFLHYYYGHYIPMGYFSPCGTWVLKKEFTRFLDDLLKKNYYLVSSKLAEVSELLPHLDYNTVTSEGNYIALKKNEFALLLPASNQLLSHTGTLEALYNNSLYRPPIRLKERYTIELVVKPDLSQSPNARLVGNIRESNGRSGFVIQQNNTNQNQFLFAYGMGQDWSTPALFKLDANKWNYLVITVNKNAIEIFNNTYSVFSGLLKNRIENNNTPLIIGNPIGQNTPFNGLIREIKITDECISKEEIAKNMEIITNRLK